MRSYVRNRTSPRLASAAGRRIFLSQTLTALASFAVGIIGVGATPGAHAQSPTKEAAIADYMHCTVTTVQQVQLILADLAGRTPVQKKMSPRFIWAARVARGLPQVAGVPDRPIRVKVLPGGLVDTMISVTSVNPLLTGAIKASGGTVIRSYANYKKIRALLPLLQIEKLAGRSDITFIDTRVGLHHGGKRPMVGDASQHDGPLVPYRFASLVPKKTTGAPQTLAGVSFPFQSLPSASLLANVLQQTTYYEGDTTHQANTARATYGITGKGIKIGVMSDDVDYLPDLEASGDLPAVTVVPGQSGDDTGDSGTGEGTAMLTIVHALAPDATLFFATANSTPEDFASNIITLRDTYGCDIIIDDVEYEDESPFSDGVIAQAVDYVTGEGALYFSSAGNAGNKSLRTHTYTGVGGKAMKPITNTNSNCWEGDFNPAGPGIDIYQGGVVIGTVPVTIHGFTDSSGNVTPYETTGDGNPKHDPEYDQFDPYGGYMNLNWADAYNAANDTYLVLTTDSAGNMIDFEGPGGEPYTSAYFAEFGDQAYVLNYSGVQTALHLSVEPIFGFPAAAPGMNIVTQYQTHGHSSSAKAFSVAAIGAIAANDYDDDDNGPYPNPFTSANKVNYFSSDGPRRIFYTADSSGNPLPVNKGHATFASGSYLTREKPDIAAADGVDTATPTFAPFYGTSAAAPHAGAIAGLILSYGTKASPIVLGDTTIVGRNLSIAEMRAVLTGSAIKSVDSDAYSAYSVNGATGVESGAGIVMPIPAIQFLQNFLSPTSVTAKQATSNSYTVSWTTDLPSTSVVHYGKTPTTMTLIARSGALPSTVHTVTVPNIASGSTYYYTVESVTPTGSVSYVGGPADAVTLVGGAAPGQRANVLLSNLALSRTAAGLIQAVITLTNTGAADASDTTFKSTLAGFASTPATSDLGTLKAGKSASATVTFPTLTSGTLTTFVITGSDGVNAFSSTVRVQIP